MTIINKDFDYLEFQIIRQKTNQIIFENGDKITADGDVLHYELKDILEITFEKVYYYNSFLLYKTLDDSIFLRVDNMKTSLQLKSLFFLKHKDKIDKLYDFLIKRFSDSIYITRADYAIDFQSEKKIEQLKKSIDFKKLLTITYEKNKIIETIMAKNTQFQVVLYNKEEELNTKQKEDYKKIYEQNNQLKDLKRLEIRIRHKNNLESLTYLFLNKNKDFKEESNDIFSKFIKKRIIFKRFFNNFF